MPTVLGEIIPNGGNFAVVDSSNIRGGFKQVSTIKDRDNIVNDKLKVGTLVYVTSLGNIYEWTGGSWKLFNISNSLGEIQLLTISNIVKDITTKVIGDIQYYGIECYSKSEFKAGDILGWDFKIEDNQIIGTYTRVVLVYDNTIYVQDNVPSINTNVYLVGSISDITRRCVTIIHPYNESIVISQFVNSNLENVNTKYSLRIGQTKDKEWKVYAEDAYIKGTLVNNDGVDITKLAVKNKEAIDTGFNSIRREFNYDNLLNNPSFLEGMNCWIAESTAKYFRINSKYILTNKQLLSSSKQGTYIIMEDNQAVLRLINSYITQKNSSLKEFTDLDTKVSPYYVLLIFSYKAITSGVLKVSIKNTQNNTTTQTFKVQKELVPTDNYVVWKSSFLWDGQGDFTLEYTGEIRIKTIVLKLNEVLNLELKYKKLFDMSDTLIKMASEYKG